MSMSLRSALGAPVAAVVLLSGSSPTAAQSALDVTMAMDPVRTSMVCAQTRSPDATLDAPFVHSCAAYAVPDDRLERLRSGHGLSDDELEAQVAGGTGADSLMAMAFGALRAVSGYRGGIPDSSLSEGPKLMVRFSRNPDGKRQLLGSGLLPNASEWERLTKEHPTLAHELRRFLRDWIGYVDPLFRVTLRNTTADPIEVSRLKYVATRRGEPAASFAGVSEPARYLLDLAEGTHIVNLVPPIVVPARGSTAADMILRLKQHGAGGTYDISATFVAAQKLEAALPTFAISFVTTPSDR